MRKTIQIVPASHEHLDQICDLWRERQTILSQTDPRFHFPNAGTGMSFRETMRSRLDGTGLLLVGVGSKGIAGYITGTIHSPSGHIDSIALDPHTYHIGLGRALWESLSETTRKLNVTELFISVPRYYAVEQAFWRSLGAVTWTPEAYDKQWELPPELMWMTW